MFKKCQLKKQKIFFFILRYDFAQREEIFIYILQWQLSNLFCFNKSQLSKQLIFFKILKTNSFFFFKINF